MKPAYPLTHRGGKIQHMVLPGIFAFVRLSRLGGTLHTMDECYRDMAFEGGGLMDLVIKPSLHTAVHHNSAD